VATPLQWLEFKGLGEFELILEKPQNRQKEQWEML
jgi:hypothetical protein